MNKTAIAFAPAAISSFFEICDQQDGNNSIQDFERIGARGGGFGVQRGILTKITTAYAKNNTIKVFINEIAAPEAKTTITAVQMLLSQTKDTYNVVVDHKINVPIGAGFGTSAGGALTACLALKEALGLPLTLNQVGKVAHAAEIKCQTGLGTVSSLTQGGGCILVVEPGAPGTCIIDHIPVTPNYLIISAVIQTVSKKIVLSSPERKYEVNKFGKRTLEDILAEPSLDNFLNCCWQFAQNAGFATDRVRQLVHLAKKAGAIGATQNMVGEAVHAIAHEENASTIAEAFKEVVSKESIIISKLDFQGARLLVNEA